MPTQTPNLKIILYNEGDGATTFEDYWHSINLNGDGSQLAYSGFQLIDTEFGKIYTNIAPVFSTSSTYAVDDFVIYQGVLYKCISPVTTAGDFDNNNWQSISLINYIQTSLSNIESLIGDIDSILTTINSGSGV